jgi:hypothetical protein
MKTFRLSIIVLLFLFSYNSFSQEIISENNCQNGDVIFIKNPQLPNTQSADRNKFNCGGIIFIEKGSPMVYFASEPLKKCSFSEFIKISDGKKFTIKRLEESSLLTEEAVNTMHIFAAAKLDTPYDYKEELFSDALYNAEFIWKIYKTCLGIYISEAKDYTASGDSKKNYSHTAANSLSGKFVSIHDIYRSALFE